MRGWQLDELEGRPRVERCPGPARVDGPSVPRIRLCGVREEAHCSGCLPVKEILLVRIMLVLLLALAGAVLGTLLEFALWAVVLTVLGSALLGLVIWRAASSRTGSTGRTPAP